MRAIKTSIALAAFALFITAGESFAQNQNRARAGSAGKTAGAGAGRARAATGTAARGAPAGARAGSTARASANSRMASARERTVRGGDTAYGSMSGAPPAGEKNCRDQFAFCMDQQIAPILGRYDYLARDPAVRSVMSSPEPLRCIFYDPRAFLNSSQMQAQVAPDKSSGKYGTSSTGYSFSGTRGGNNSGADAVATFKAFPQDINFLFMTYNFYCQIDRSTKDDFGQFINRCVVPNDKTRGSDKAAVFATRDATAYFMEANRRIEEDELKLLNFEETDLFKNKLSSIIADCELPTGDNVDQKTVERYNKDCAANATKAWQQFSITARSCPADKPNCSDDEKVNGVGDLFSDLGLVKNGKELFSINVSPPLGAGTLDVAGTFKRASDICFSSMKLGPMEKSQLEGANLGELQKSIDRMGGCARSFNRADLEDYYLTGRWFVPCEEGFTYNETSSRCVDNEDPSNVVAANSAVAGNSLTRTLTSFHSASRSCEYFEHALISARNYEFGRFDTALKNYIEENIAKIIQKKTKDMAKISQAFMGLKELVTSLETNMMKMRTEAFRARNQAEMDIMQAELDLADMRMDITRQEIAHRRERAKIFSEAYGSQIAAICMPKVQGAFQAVCGMDWMQCGGGDVRDFLAKNGIASAIAAAMSNQSVYINAKGDIKASPGSSAASLSANSGEIIELNNSKIGGTDVGDGYERVFCMSMPNAAAKFVQPIRSDMGRLYDGIFQANCTGKLPDWMAAAAKAASYDDSTKNAMGNVGTVVGVGAGIALATGAAAVIFPVGTAIAATAATALAIGGIINGLTPRTSESISFGPHFINANGQCYVTQITTKTTSKAGVLGIGASSTKSQSKIDIPIQALADHRMGKGLQIFDTGILQALQLD